MFHLRSCSYLVVLSSSLLATACGGSSGGGGGGAPVDTDALEREALRVELSAAGVEPLPAPPAVSDELFTLGQALFFDKVLSGNQDVSCATCHLPQFATGDGRTLPDGVHGIGLGPLRGEGMMIPRNSPALFAAHAKQQLFWDGHLRRVVELIVVPRSVALSWEMRNTFDPELALLGVQAMLPPVSRGEMRGLPGENDLGDVGDGYGGGGSGGGAPENTQVVWDELNERLLDLPGYVELLQAAYPGVAIGDFNFAHAGNAIAGFEARAFARTDSPFQRFLRGDDAALTRDEVRGGLAFVRAGCAQCHSGPLLSDEAFHNSGLPQLGPGVTGGDAPVDPAGMPIAGPDLGREVDSGRAEDRFRFRTPSLHNVALTAPYGHAGQFATLRDMVAHYRDVEVSHLLYDVGSNVDDPELVHMVVPNSSEVLAALDPLLPVPNEFDVDAVLAFLHALTADDARDLADVVPAFVPSGLPVF